jgi:hypothetical protein
MIIEILHGKILHSVAGDVAEVNCISLLILSAQAPVTRAPS